MSWEQLPVETTSDIFSYLHDDDDGTREYADHGHPTLCALGLTCRRLSSVAISQLYGDIVFEVNRKEAKDLERLRLFDRACRANPSLVDRILSVNVRYFEDADTHAEAYDELLRHLAASKSLKRLESQLSSHKSGSPLPALYDHHSGSFPAVTHLQVQLDHVEKEHFLPAERLSRLCELPALEQLTVMAPIGGIRDQAKLREMGTQPFPHLKHLHFWCARPVSLDALQIMLPRAPNLTCLSLGLPGSSTEVNRKYSDDSSSLGYDLDGPVQPRLYGELLAPVKSSLTSLELDADNVHYPSHDGSRIDLSAFANLTTLKLSCALVFGSDMAPALNEGLWRLLPPRLEHLSVGFDGYQGLYWSLHDMRSHAREHKFAELWRHRLEESSVDWVVSLLKRKGEQNNILKSITIEEREIIDRDPNWKIGVWKGAYRLGEMAAAVGVELVIRLRVPRNFESDEMEGAEEPWHVGKPGTVSYADDVDPNTPSDDGDAHSSGDEST
ncbi:Uu.00g034580.m01.CDS01 [Anthostomella pinea]|uniref:Uu.00g034580.m01.CDS01 n=1 Tax=Anthostomella pinea TaxID=933095 RepID=A0AAI8VA29_9PEZI|nr:Uu.00g034580.m01.CDS01 [Anthostomella pinea]